MPTSRVLSGVVSVPGPNYLEIIPYVRPRLIFLEAPRGPVQLKPGLRPTIRQLKSAPVRGTEGPVRGTEGPVTGTGPLLIA